MFTNATDKFGSLVMTSLADVDGFKLFIEVFMWLDFPAPKTCTDRFSSYRFSTSSYICKHNIYVLMIEDAHRAINCNFIINIVKYQI